MDRLLNHFLQAAATGRPEAYVGIALVVALMVVTTALSAPALSEEEAHALTSKTT